MRRNPIESWQIADWNRALFRHYFSEHSGSTPITRLAVTGEELCKAAEGILGPEEARESLISTLRESMGNRSLGTDAQRKAAVWDSNEDSPPPFIPHLLFTCMVVGDMAEELESVGDFRKRLKVLLGGGTGHGLERLPDLWQLLSDWLKGQYESQRPVRRLILPLRPGYLRIIGYSYCLAFPTRRDQERLRRILRSAHLLGSEPPVARVFDCLEDRLSQFTPQFQKTYREFRDLYHVSPKSVSAATAFWSVIRDAALKIPTGESSRKQSPKLQLALEMDIEGYSLVVLSSREFSIKHFATVSFPSGLKDYPFLVTSTDDKPIEPALLTTHDSTASPLPSIFSDLDPAIGEGVLLFVADETGQMYVQSPEFPEAGKVLGLLKDDLLVRFALVLKKAGLEGEYSAHRSDLYLGWNEIEIADAAALSEVDFGSDSVLAGIKSLQQVLRPPRMLLIGGAKLGQSYLGLGRFLPDVIIESADSVTAQLAAGQETISLRSASTGTWRFPTDICERRLDGSYQLRAFTKKDLIDWRPVSFTSDVHKTEYVAPSNLEGWLGEARASESAPPLEWPVAPGDCFRVDEEKQQHAVSDATSPETGEPQYVAQSPIVDELISFLAARSCNQQGILEFELVSLLKDHLGLDWNSVWYVYRAWVEMGAFESLSLRTWRTRKCFARRPCLVAYPLESSYRIALFGLIPPALRTRFEKACESMNCAVHLKRALSSWVPGLSWTEMTAVNDIDELQRRSGVERALWLQPLSQIVMPIASVSGSHAAEPLNWEVHRIWDFDRQIFGRSEDEHVEQAVVLRWYRRSDRADYFSISRDGSPVWWGWSKTWALLRAYELARQVPFKKIGRRLMKTDAAHVHLPLPLARATAITGPFLPGPIGTNSKDVAYLYSFPGEKARSLAIQGLWSDLPDGPKDRERLPIDLEVLWRQSTIPRLDALSMPVLLRDRLASDPLLRRFAELRTIPRSVLPILLSLAERTGQNEEGSVEESSHSSTR